MQQTLNPYGKILGDRNAFEVIANTPARLKTLAGTLLPAKTKQSYAPGKWTALEIFCHLADCEIAFAFRLRQSAAEDDHVIQPFDQDAWAVDYKERNATQAIEVFSILRAWNLAFVNNQPQRILFKSVTHPERGPMTFETILQTMGGHDLNHLQQLELIADQN